MTKKLFVHVVKAMDILESSKKLQWPEKEEVIVVQCPMCDSEGEIEDVERKPN